MNAHYAQILMIKIDILFNPMAITQLEVLILHANFFISQLTWAGVLPKFLDKCY